MGVELEEKLRPNMSTFLILFLGVTVGFAVRLMIPGKEPWDWFASIGFGILGASLGAGLGRVIGLYREDDTGGVFAAAFGAVFLALAFVVTTQRRRWRENRVIR